MISQQKLTKLQELVTNFNSKNDTEKLATLLMLPRMLDKELIQENDLQRIFSNIGFKFINKLLRNKTENSALYREVSVAVLLKYSTVTTMVKDVKMLKNIPVLCEIINQINKNKSYINLKIDKLSIGSSKKVNDVMESNSNLINNDIVNISTTSSAAEPSSKSHSSTNPNPHSITTHTNQTSVNPTESTLTHHTSANNTPSNNTNILKDSCLAIITNLSQYDEGIEALIDNSECLSQMMISYISDAGNEDDDWKKCMHVFIQILTKIPPPLITTSQSIHLSSVLIHLSKRAFNKKPSGDCLLVIPFFNSLISYLNQEMISALSSYDFFELLIDNLFILHASKIVQAEKDKCLELSCRLVERLGVECFMPHKEHTNGYNSKGDSKKNCNNKTNIKSESQNNNTNIRDGQSYWNFFNLLLRLVSMEIQLGLDSDHAPDEVTKASVLMECTNMLEVLLHYCATSNKDTEYIQDNLYEVVHYSLIFFKEIDWECKEQITWWHRLLLRYLMAYMSVSEGALDEEVIDSIPCLLSVCSLICREDFKDDLLTKQQELFCCGCYDLINSNNNVNKDYTNDKSESNCYVSTVIGKAESMEDNNEEKNTRSNPNTLDDSDNINKGVSIKNNYNRNFNANNNEELLRMFLPALGHATHVEEVMMMMTATLEGQEVMMMILKMFTRELSKWVKDEGSNDGLKALGVMTCDVLSNIIFHFNKKKDHKGTGDRYTDHLFNSNSRNLDLFADFCLFMTHFLPKADRGRLRTEVVDIKDLLAFVTCCVIVLRDTHSFAKLGKECLTRFKDYIGTIIVCYEKGQDIEEDDDDSYKILLNELKCMP